MNIQQEIIDAPGPQPVLVVEVEPDYWHRGHYCEGSKSYINPLEVWKLPVGTKLYTAPPHQSEHHLEMVNTPAPSVPGGHVYVYVSGLTGSGKSAVAGEIEIALRASGLDVEWVDSESEKHLTHADYTSALELYRPKVRIFEKNISRTAAAPPPQMLSDERIFDLLKQVDPRAVRLPLGFKQFAIAIEREILGE